MIVNELNINNLRNHNNTNIQLEKGINIFYGKNGSGKTTILEALSILSISKSFLPTLDNSLIQNGQQYYSLSAICTNELDVPYRIAIKYNGKGRKIINSNLGDNLLPKNIVGEIPVVILSPDFKIITFGAPQDRRQFLDGVLSQSSRIYIEEAIKLKKLLKQRNTILIEYQKNKKIDYHLFETISEMFINCSAEIISRRSKFIYKFAPYFNQYYQRIANNDESVAISYRPNSFDDDLFQNVLEKNDIIDRYQNRFEYLKDKEIIRGTTLFGPQKDDIEIKISGKPARESASQGQHKTLLLSLKFAEYELLKNIKNESPIFMLDDIFSELDIDRSYNINKIINELNCQTLITITNRERFEPFNQSTNQNSFYHIANGSVNKD